MHIPYTLNLFHNSESNNRHLFDLIADVLALSLTLQLQAMIWNSSARAGSPLNGGKRVRNDPTNYQFLNTNASGKHRLKFF